MHYTVKAGFSENPSLGSTIVYRAQFYIHTFKYVFHKIEKDSLRLRWTPKEGQ